MNVIIVEDEKLAADELEELLHAYDPSIRIMAKIDSVQGTVDWLQQNTCDLIFLDIHLADDIGFKIFEKIKVRTPVIFTTAYDEYAIRAFSINSIDYLLKPIETQRLAMALDKYNDLKQQVSGDGIERLIEAYNSKQIQYQGRFIVHAGDRIRSIISSDIAYFYAQQRYVILFTNKNEQYIIDYTLEKLEQVLNPEQFFRINRQFIVSFDAIKNMFPYTKGRIKIETEPLSKEEIVVSVDRAARFKHWLNR